ncbi:arsenate reductase (glutaredoxin) [Reinekea marina]|nr:arsenate reductase (glutaredoxin) [Reinekea marina]MDN3649742.1 arsenate reductase (glutaredoxin) [Reinekea marina]
MTEMTATIYHNPRCSKSRQALALLEEKGIDANIKLYLKESLTAKELKELISDLGIKAHDILRTKEVEYKELGLSAESTESDIINALINTPKLLERPIVKTVKGARIGRPTDAILDIL